MSKLDTPSSAVIVVNGNVEKALRTLKKKMVETNKLKEARARMEYVKPTEKRKKDKKRAESRWKKKISADTLPKKMY
jgi:ribosomal protein S21